MRKTLAASAIGATLLIGGPTLAAQAAPSDSPSPVATATATASSTEQVQTTVTKTESDKTGLWGLLGLAGLAGLIPRKRHEPVRHVEPARTTVTPAAHTEARRVDHVDNPIRTAETHNDANDVRVRTEDTLRNNNTTDRRNI